MVLARTTYRQEATYFPAPVENSYGGFTFGDPELLKVRWYEKVEIFTDEEGNEQRSLALVYLQKRVDTQGYLVKGDHTDKSDPTTIRGAYYIKRVDTTPDLRGLNEEVKAYL